MKKFYEAPELELIKFHQEDVLAESNGDVEDMGGGYEEFPGINFPK